MNNRKLSRNQFLIIQMMIENPFIEWYQLKNQDCLKFTFRDKLTEKNANIAIDRWKKLFDTQKGKKITLVWECKEMTGYEPLARIIWQKALKDLKNQIDCIWLVSESRLIQAGARIMSLFTSITISSANAEDKVMLD